MRIAAYMRVSTTHQDTDNQRIAFAAWFKTNGKADAEVTEYVDDGISGYHDRRPAYQRLLKDAYRKRFNTIVVFALDRFGRNASEAIKTLLDLDALGVEFISITQPMLTMSGQNPFRRTILAAFAEIAEMERKLHIERVNAGIARARQRGARLGAKPKLNQAIRGEILELRGKGLSLKAIGAKVGLSASTVHLALKKLNNKTEEVSDGRDNTKNS